jgi:hypothetical protein
MLVGNEVISPAYEFCYGFSSGVAVVKDVGTYRFIRPDGSPLFNATYDQAYSFVLWPRTRKTGVVRARGSMKTGSVVFRWIDEKAT